MVSAGGENSMKTLLRRLLDCLLPPASPKPCGEDAVPETPPEIPQEETLILPVSLVMVDNQRGNTNSMVRLDRAMQESVRWWLEQANVQLRPQYYALEAPNEILDVRNPDLPEAHFWQLHIPVPAVYVGVTAATVSGGNWGEARGDGIAVVAGNTPIPGGGTYTGPISDHEIGHILGETHLEDTFMGASIDSQPRVMDGGQRERIRAAVQERFAV